MMFLVLRPFSKAIPWFALTETTLIEKFMFYRPGEIDMILSDLHSIIYVPPLGDRYRHGELQFFHASLPDFLLDRSRSKDHFLDQGAAYAKLTGLALKHLNNPTESPLWAYLGITFPSCLGFTDSMRIKTKLITYFGFVASKLIHPRSSLRTCAG